jgi:hypothetical protein
MPLATTAPANGSSRSGNRRLAGEAETARLLGDLAAVSSG